MMGSIQTDDKFACDYCGHSGVANIEQELTGSGKLTDPWIVCAECGSEDLTLETTEQKTT